MSFSYPLPGTVFYERVKAQLGPKRNWTDSDDLCIMFNAAYSGEFYRLVRNALHAEVDSWHEWAPSIGSRSEIKSLWQSVDEAEPMCRNTDVFEFPEISSDSASSALVSIAPSLPLRRA
jgi:hypothetical protein